MIDIMRSVQATLTTITRYHRLQFRLPPGLPPVVADPRRIGLVIVILIDSAVRESDEGDCIEVSVKDSGREVTVNIGNQKHAALARFGRDTASRDSSLEGHIWSSLELSFCRRVIKAHGGRIWTETGGENGPWLSFSLPVASGMNACETGRPETATEKPAGER